MNSGFQGKNTKGIPTILLNNLKVLNDVLTTVSASGTTLAQESTLLSVLNAIVASDQDIEILLVRDTVTLIVYQQITNYETGVPVVTYQAVDGTPFVPTNPMEYLDPSAVLNLMLTEALNQGITLDNVETLLTTIDTVLDNIKTNTDDNATETTLVAVLAKIIAAPSTEAKQDIIETSINAVETLLTPITTRVHNTVVTTASGTIAAGSLRGSVLNNGANPGTWNAIQLPAGVSIPWEAVGQGDKYGAIAYDASSGLGTTFIIEYTT
jgi:hypothetical protein